MPSFTRISGASSLGVAGAAELANARLSIVAETAQAFFALRGARMQMPPSGLQLREDLRQDDQRALFVRMGMSTSSSFLRWACTTSSAWTGVADPGCPVHTGFEVIGVPERRDQFSQTFAIGLMAVCTVIFVQSFACHCVFHDFRI